MPSLQDALIHMRLLEDLAVKHSFVHRLHPLAKLLTAVMFIAAVVSFDRHAVIRLFPFLLYPVLVLALADLPAGPVFRRVLFVEPMILGIGILNPLFDRSVVLIAGLPVNSGWITFLSLAVKGTLTVLAGALLVSTTGMEPIAASLRMLRVPKGFVLQLLLTWRYLSVLLEEVLRMMRALQMRAPGRQGVEPAQWGSFAGQLLLRTFDRAQRVHQAMLLRGFDGEHRTGALPHPGWGDAAWLLGWTAFLAAARACDLPLLLGKLLLV